jgi:hypothetical protein
MRKAAREEKKKNIGEHNRSKKLVIFGVVTVFLLVVGFLVFRPRMWRGGERFVLARAMKDGNVSVVVFNSRARNIATVLIPKNTQVDVAGNLGKWQIGNVWKLGESEKRPELLAYTIMKSFAFPVDAWEMEGEAGKTNLSLGDRIKIYLFNLRVPNSDKIMIDLADTNLLNATYLSDGEKGYEIGNIDTFVEITHYFSLDEMANKQSRIIIVNNTGEHGVVDEVSSLLGVTGGKIVSVNNNEVEENFDCKIQGREIESVNYIAKILGCGVTRNDNDFIEVVLGKDFLKRF